MLIESFIAHIIRSKTARYFTFGNIDSISPAAAPDYPIQLYIHIPFCLELCPYCSFHRVIYREEASRKYFKSLKKELDIYASLGFHFSSVYIGGGTPTIDMYELLGLLDTIHGLFSPQEISVETNPDRLDPYVLSSLARMDVKRVSVGIQTFQDDLLRMIGRYEKYGSGERLKERCKNARGYIDTLNADMIFNFPAQSMSMLEADLDILREIGPDQVTYYPLMISDATRSKMEKIMGKQSYQKEKQFYNLISSRLGSQYQPSSAWCFSRKGGCMIDEYIVSAREYVGVGSGAFGLVGNAIYANTFSLKQYTDNLDQGRLPLKAKKDFSRKEMARYTFLMELFGLRLDRDAFRQTFNTDIWTLLGPELLFFTLIGGIRWNGRMFSLTQKGRYYWVIMMREFFTGVDNFRDFSRKVVGLDSAI